MDVNAYENFLLVPGENAGGQLYELSPTSAFGRNTFVLLPYQNPQVKQSSPRFYSITKKTKINDLSFTGANASKPIQLTAGTSKQHYLKTIGRLKEQIQQGNIYEINYCINFFAGNVVIDPLDVFLKLNNLAKAPYAALLKTGNDFILCASPELFLKKEGSTISTKPIKGTARRGITGEEDEQLKKSLQENIKERTENVMAVDVARNDLSQFAKKGTVQVNRLYNIETFETVHQMVSTVSCEIKDELFAKPAAVLFEKIIEATFPMASMTGAPKLRAMHLTDAYENFERSAYSGAMGLVDEQEDFTLAVIIRSIFYNQQTKRLSFAVGGAITYLSDPEKEYEECLLKANALLKALNAFIV